MAKELNVTGLDELQKFMTQLPAKLEKNVMRGALRAGAKEIMIDAKAKAPVGAPNQENKKLYGGYPGALRDSLRIGTSVKFNTIIAYIRAGGRNKKTGAIAYYAHMVEYGTKRHLIIPKKRGGKLKIGNSLVSAVMHPGTKARPFMRPALDSRASAAVNAAAAHMRKVLARKYGLNAPYAFVEGDE